jgi:uncharacterized protein YtpQ (UPF0354 family)
MDTSHTYAEALALHQNQVDNAALLVWWRRRREIIVNGNMFIRLCVFLLILAAIAPIPGAAQGVPKEEIAFTQYMAAQLRREVGHAVVVNGPLTLMIGTMQANLDRVFLFCTRNRAGCDREIATYVRAAAQVYKDKFAPPSKQTIRIIVRTRAYVAKSQAAIPKEGPKLQLRELAGSLVMIPAIDMPRTIRMVTEKDNQTLGLTPDEVFKLGLANLRDRLKPLMEVAKIAQRGQIGHLSGDPYHSSRLALHSSWAPLVKAHGGKLVVAVPATDTVLYVGDDTPAAVDALRTLAKSVLTRAPAPLSSELLRWTPSRWELVR